MKNMGIILFLCILMIPAKGAATQAGQSLDALVRGAQLQDAGQPKAAEGYFRQALEQDPENVYAMNQLGLALLKQGERQAAGLWLQRAALASDDNRFARVWLGVLSLQDEKVEEAERAFQEVLDMDEENPDAHYFLGVIRMNQGQVADAVEHSHKAGAGAVKDASLQYRLARAYVKLDMTEEAMNAYERALEITPNLGQALLGLGWLRYNQGDRNAAWDLWQKALEVDAVSSQASASLAATANEQAMAACAQGDRDGAVNNWKMALRFAPNDRAARYHLQHPSGGGVCREQGGLLP